MNNLAIIPARGGSKRIPKKNIKHFLGKPIIAYSIELAKQSGLFSEVMVSTDDNEIADVALECGAKVPFFRSGKNADDFATTVEVIHEVLNWYKANDIRFDSACCIYPTAPLIQISDLKLGHDFLVNEDLESVFPVIEFSYPIWRALELDEHNYSKLIWQEHLNHRSQDIKKAYHDAGQWYWFNPDKISESLYSNNSKSIVISEMHAQDIDTLIDWQLAELKYKIMHEA